MNAISNQRHEAAHIEVDNRPECISHKLHLWFDEIKIILRYIQPGRPKQKWAYWKKQRKPKERITDGYLLIQSIFMINAFVRSIMLGNHFHITKTLSLLAFNPASIWTWHWWVIVLFLSFLTTLWPATAEFLGYAAYVLYKIQLYQIVNMNKAFLIWIAGMILLTGAIGVISCRSNDKQEQNAEMTQDTRADVVLKPTENGYANIKEFNRCCWQSGTLMV